MKKNIVLMFTTACCILLQTQVFSDPLIDAINKLNADVKAKIGNTSASETKNITTLLNTIFVRNPLSGGPSVVDARLYALIHDFFKVYTTKKDFNTLDFTSTSEANKNALKTLLAKEVGYNVLRNSLEASKDTNTLLIQSFENPSNDFDQASVNLSTLDASSPYRSMDNMMPTAQNVPTFSDLVGVDSYSNNNDKNKAKLFISYLLQAIPAPKNFIIPDNNTGQNKVYMYLPIADKDNGTAYTYKEISTQPGETKYKSLPDSEPKIEYDRMVNYLKKDKTYYQPYKMKVRGLNVLRTLYTDSLYRAYQDRVKDGTTTNLSLVEREKLVAATGLDKSYYEGLLTNATLADFAIEILKSVNKLSYFIYRIHQDIERLTLITALSGLQNNFSNIQDELNYVKPIYTLIKNNCWDRKIMQAGDSRIKLCDNPRSDMSTMGQ